MPPASNATKNGMDGRLTEKWGFDHKEGESKQCFNRAQCHVGGMCGSKVRDMGAQETRVTGRSPPLPSYKMEILKITLSFSQDFVQVK